jgi:O-antigen/teichoic acid export membrane protein
MSVFKKLASDTALYGLTTILPRLLNFLLVPLQTYIFTEPEEMSSNVVLYTYVAFFLAIYTFGLETAFFRQAARLKGPENQVNRNKSFNETLTIVLIITVIGTVLIIGLAPQITDWLDYRGQEQFVVWVALLVAIDALMAIPFARLRVENKGRSFAQAKLTNVLLIVCLNLFFLVFCRDIALGRYLTFLQSIAQKIYNPAIGAGYIFLANLLANAFYFWLLRKTLLQFRPRLNKADAWALVVYSFPLMLTTLAGLFNTLADRALLGSFLPDGFYANLTTKGAIGVYGNCYKLSVFMSIAIQSFRYAADPFFFSRADDKDSPALLARVTKWFVIICVLIWVGVSLNLDLIAVIMLSEKYRVGLAVVPILLLANLFLGIYYNISFWFKLSDKTVFGTYITVAGAASTILLNIVLIPQMGYMGCAVAFLISSMLMTGLCYYFGEKYYPVQYDLRSALGYISGAGLLIIGASFVKIPNLWLAVPYHVLLFGLFLAIIAIVERETVGVGLARLRNR